MMTIDTFRAMTQAAGFNLSGLTGGNGIFRAEVADGCDVRFYDNARIGGSGLNGWFFWVDGEMVAAGPDLWSVAASARAGNESRIPAAPASICAHASGAPMRWNLANYRDQFMREHCRGGQAAMYDVTVCAVAFSPLYTGGDPGWIVLVDQARPYRV